MPLNALDLFAVEAAAKREGNLFSPAELFVENTKLHPHHVAEHLRRFHRSEQLPHLREELEKGCKRYPTHPRLALSSLVSDDPVAALLAPAAQSFPSPNPCEIYVAIWRSEAVAAGIYHFDVRTASLEILASGEPAAVRSAAVQTLLDPSQAEGAGALIVLTGIPLRLTWRQGDRGYRSLFLVAGRILESLCRRAVDAGLTPRMLDAFFDDKVHRLLGIDGLDELAIWLLFAPCLGPGER